MASASIDGAKIRDWKTFHLICAHAFGFPGFYGMNMNAWVDCMSDLREPDNLTRFTLAADETLRIEVRNSAEFQQRVPDVYEALAESIAFVNRRYLTAGQPPALDLVFH